MFFLLSCFYFMLPAYFANMAPVIVRRINFLKIPIDFYRKIENKPVFGMNKTFRGLVFGVSFAIIISYLQHFIYVNGIFIDLAFTDYANWLLFGFLMGFGAIFGDLIESFVKRRLNYAPGRAFVPFDQIDFVVGALVFVYPIVILSMNKVLAIIVLSFILHITINHLAFYTDIRREKW